MDSLFKKAEVRDNKNGIIVDSDHNNLKDTFVINTVGAKNAILPLMISKLLIPDKTTFTNVPTDIEDVKIMANIITCLGLECRFNKLKLEIINNGVSENIIIPENFIS